MINSNNLTKIRSRKIKRTPAETIAVLDSLTVKLGYKTNSVELVKQARAGKL